MSKSGSVVAPLGNLVDLVRRQNKDLITETLVGVDINKNLIEEKIKGKKTDLRRLQIVSEGNFIANLMHVGRDKKLPVALYEKQNLSLISPAYRIFFISSSQLIDKFLILFFKQSKIDLICSYYAERDIRGSLSWKDFTSIPITIPPLNKQERIVKKYQTATRYIELKKRINELFEKQMTAYYHILFDNLTDYTIKNFGELFTIIRGGRPPRGNQEQEKKYFCKEGGIPWLQVRDISKKGFKFVDKTEESLTEEGFRRANCHVVSPEDLIFIHNASSSQLGKIYVNSSELTMNTNFWGISNNLARGGGASR